MAACVKHLGASLPIGQIVFARGVISLVLIAAVAWWISGLHLLTTRNPRAHAWRSLSGTTSMFCWFYALTLIPLAEFTAISFTAPMFLTVLAMVFLRERIHVYRCSALIVGMIGVLIVTLPHFRPGSGSTLGVTLALSAAVLAALAMMFVRHMSGAGREHAVTITFYFMLTSTLCAIPTVLYGWHWPNPEQWLFILMIGVFGAGGQLVMTYSYRYAEASMIAPLDYSSLVFAVTYGYLFFGETPGWSIWTGAPLVIAAGLIILWREYRHSRAVAASVVPES